MFNAEHRIRRVVLVGLLVCIFLVATASPYSGHASPLQVTAPTLGTAANFAVLAGSTITNTGTSIVNGNLGVSPGTAVTGFPPGIVTQGTIHKGDAVAAQAESDAGAASSSLAKQTCNTDLTGQDLGGLSLTAGVYCFSSSAQLTGSLTLNGQGNSNAVFVFQIGSTLTTASASSVVLTNSAQSCNVFFQVGSSATLGTSTAFAGTILASTSITLNTGANVDGRALAGSGAVTLDTNRVSSPACSSTPIPTPTATVGPPTATATPVTPTATTAATTAAATATAVAATATASAATATAISTGTSVTPQPTGTTAVGAPSPTSPTLAASYVRVHRSHGITHLQWYSTDRVRGYNIFDAHTRINRRLVTSHSHWYHFKTRHVFHHLRLVGK